VLVRNRFLSLDPYMRGRMDDAKSYAAPQKLDETMVGGTAGEVVESRNPRFAIGDAVVGMLGWQLYGVSDGSGLTKVDTSRIPLSAYLGSVGMPGVTAWYGLNRIIAPKAGETIVVSAASGAVGSVVGQLAKAAGCRAVGIAGGPQKCAIVTDEYGFDACVDYKAGRLYEDLRAATPDGVDGLFENVGGEPLDATLRRMNAFGRVAVCGLISGYSGQPMPVTPSRWMSGRRRCASLRGALPTAACAIARRSHADSRVRPRRSSGCWPGATSASSWSHSTDRARLTAPAPAAEEPRCNRSRAR